MDLDAVAYASKNENRHSSRTMASVIAMASGPPLTLDPPWETLLFQEFRRPWLNQISKNNLREVLAKCRLFVQGKSCGDHGEAQFGLLWSHFWRDGSRLAGQGKMSISVGAGIASTESLARWPDRNECRGDASNA
jgi:hypothetical protein